MKVVSSCKDLKIISIRNQSFSQVIYFLRFLALTSSLRKYDIRHQVELGLIPDVSFDAYETRLFGMLEIKAMAFCDLAIDSLFDPCNLIYESVAPFVKHVQGKSILVVDDPDEEEAALLYFVERNFQNIIVCQSTVGNGNSSGWVGRGELPWWVTSDHVEQSSSVLHLSLGYLVKVYLHDILTDWNGPEMLDVRLLLESLKLLVMVLNRHVSSLEIVSQGLVGL